MKRDIPKRLDALEARNDNRKGVYVFKWLSWTREEAIARRNAERASEGLPPLDPATPITFLVWRDDHLSAPVPCNLNPAGV